MEFFKVLKRRKILFLNIFLLLYISINLFMGERGLISYFEKKTLLKDLDEQQTLLTQKVKNIENKNNLLSENLNFDFVDTLIREKFKFGSKDEVLIKLND
tara:strand:- start:7 stop:306 length:300 start_codon:yes stop_codon:yes gene_type:complete